MFKRKLILFIAICCLTLCLATVDAASRNIVKKSANTTSNELSTLTTTTVEEFYYSPVNNYKYHLASAFDYSVDSFEAWIKLPTGSIGGVIMGNWTEKDYLYQTTNWEVSPSGHFGFKYNDAKISYVFNDTTRLNDDKWHHVALVRTNEAFTYYLDGALEAVYEIPSEPVISTMNMSIGVDNSSWRSTKFPLEGFVKQVTLYNGAISLEQVQADMQNTSIALADNLSSETILLGNWYLGEKWTKRVVESSVEGSPVADLHTFEKYVGADYSFGEYDYTFVIMPDIQIMVNYNVHRLNALTQWLVDNKEELKIEFIMQVGDLSDFGQRENLYQVAAAALDKFNNKIPYCFVPGNHDYNDNAASRNTEYLNRHFSVEKHSQLPGFGGVFEDNKIENNYYIFEVGEVKYLVFNLEYHPRMSVMRWASRIIEAHPEHRVIISTHDYVEPDNTFVDKVSAGYEANGSQKLFDALVSKYDNVFMAVGGHHCYDDTRRRVDYGVNGNKVLSMLIDGQGTNYKGNGAQDMVMLVHVNETNKTMNFVYYSPEQGKVWNIQNQFQYDFSDALNPTIGE